MSNIEYPIPNDWLSFSSSFRKGREEASLAKDDCAIVVNQNFSFNVLINCLRKNNFFQITTFGNQVVHGVFVAHMGDFLFDNRTGIELSGHVMTRCTNDFHASLVGSMIWFSANKCR